MYSGKEMKDGSDKIPRKINTFQLHYSTQHCILGSSSLRIQLLLRLQYFPPQDKFRCKITCVSLAARVTLRISMRSFKFLHPVVFFFRCSSLRTALILRVTHLEQVHLNQPPETSSETSKWVQNTVHCSKSNDDHRLKY